VVRTETTADGGRRTVTIGPERYTHLRWVVDAPLAPGAANTFRYRVRIR